MDYGVNNNAFRSSGSQGRQELRSDISGPEHTILSLPFPQPHLLGSRAPELLPWWEAAPPTLPALLQIILLHPTGVPLPGLLQLPRFPDTAPALSAGGSG